MTQPKIVIHSIHRRKTLTSSAAHFGRQRTWILHSIKTGPVGMSGPIAMAPPPLMGSRGAASSGIDVSEGDEGGIGVSACAASGGREEVGGAKLREGLTAGEL